MVGGFGAREPPRPIGVATSRASSCGNRLRMLRTTPDAISLDYGPASRGAKFLPNLSAVTAAGNYLWTASDEVRTIECLAPSASGYRLHRRYDLDKLFPGLPGARAGHEADIEALDVVDGQLWVCGSHSLTRRSQLKGKTNSVDARIRKRPSRRLLGVLALTEDGGAVRGPGDALPFKGVGSLRAVLGSHRHITPFMDLPSKENGLDVEGITVVRKRLHIGLRGPVVDNIAIIASMSLSASFSVIVSGVFLHFVDLDGLGVRDLTRWRDGILILAGPVSGADGPFKLFHWHPKRTTKIQTAKPMSNFPNGPDHPEGICALRHGKREGLIVVYDTSNRKRVKDTHYIADWIPL